jgi:hypothetical protein
MKYSAKYRRKIMEYEFKKNEPGIVLDYLNNTFYINIYDEDFTNYELLALRNNKITIYFKNFNLVSMFMINIDNCTDTSDMPFSIFEVEDKTLIDSLDVVKLSYNICINYIKPNGEMVSTKTITLNEKKSIDLQIKLKEALTKDYTGEAFEEELAEIYLKYEPFEIEEQCEPLVLFSK